MGGAVAQHHLGDACAAFLLSLPTPPLHSLPDLFSEVGLSAQFSTRTWPLS